MVLQAQLEQFAPLPVRTECEHLILIPVSGQYIYRAHADGASCSQHRYCLLLSHTGVQPLTNNAKANTGAAAVKLSTRSSTPPCPGKSAPLSLTPRWRLSMLSCKSPSTDTNAVGTMTASNSV